MSVFENLNNTTEKAVNIGEEYIKSTHQYFRLKIFQQLTYSISIVVKLFAVGSFVIISLFFLAIASAIALGELLGNNFYGYLIVGGVFLLFGFITFIMRKFLEKIVINTLSKKFFD